MEQVENVNEPPTKKQRISKMVTDELMKRKILLNEMTKEQKKIIENVNTIYNLLEAYRNYLEMNSSNVFRLMIDNALFYVNECIVEEKRNLIRIELEVEYNTKKLCELETK